MTLRGQKKRIGILGGMGVEATIALLQRISAATLATDDQDHVPLFVDMNPQVPSRIRHLISGIGEDPGPAIAKMAVGLERAGAEALAMPCNTAHHYAHRIEESTKVPFLNMPELTCTRLASQVGIGQAIGILASPATNRIGLFQSHLKAVGLESIHPENEDRLLASIQRIKQSGPSASDIDLLAQECVRLVDRGAAKILIGCTEFSIVCSKIEAPIQMIDALDVLTDEIIAFSGAAKRH